MDKYARKRASSKGAREYHPKLVLCSHILDLRIGTTFHDTEEFG